MKKFWSIFCLAACLTFVLVVPAFADNSKTGTMENYNNRGMSNAVPDTGMRSDIERGVERGVDKAARALDVDDRNDMNANNYRTTAVDDDNGMDWGWLGLLGLIGLAGLRNRRQERT
ncbi:WGxxGxxG family protein [Paenibacillus sp. LHD-38]|uniref:WGxxGxxG family protein n=1 Tax=Paenibacillus sp. LHD-38 TaxID=3072143 RepID=UPI00280DDEF3|nr:WGxxGxxG family protein [Paenibacillus sp. LHD-38]MDQ8733413.1 WGxxGxxG family protein [Paenibacillus sp. LHD-38]